MVSQQSTSANLTFYKFMPFCRNYHISLTAFITAFFFLLVISSCSRFEWNVDFDHDIIPEIRTLQIFFLYSLVFILFFLCFKNLFPAFFSINLIVGMYLKVWHLWNQRLDLSTQKASLSQWISHICHKLHFNRKNCLHTFNAKWVEFLYILSHIKSNFSLWARELWIKWPFMYHLVHKSVKFVEKVNFWPISANFCQLLSSFP